MPVSYARKVILIGITVETNIGLVVEERICKRLDGVAPYNVLLVSELKPRYLIQ